MYICGGLDENVPHRFKCLNILPLIGGDILEVLRGVALMEDKCL